MTKDNRKSALERQVQRLGRRIETLQQQSNRFSTFRLFAFVIGLIVSVLAGFQNILFGWGVFLAWVLIFVGIVRVHNRITHTLSQHRLLQQLKTTHLARIVLDWEKIPLPPVQSPGSEHPFAIDLDLIGNYSLHHLMDTSVSYEGSVRLKNWLLATEPDDAQIHYRQLLVKELIPIWLFREKLILAARLVNEKRWRGQSLLDWTDGDETTRFQPSALIVLTFLSSLTIVLFALNNAGILPQFWLLSLVAYLGLYGVFWRKIGDMFGPAKSLQDVVEQLDSVFHHVETFSYANTPHLKNLVQPFLDAETRPSKLLRRLKQVIAAASIQRNPIFWMVLNLLMPYDLYVAYALQNTKTALKKSSVKWLEAFFELEALASLATFAYLNPEYTFPDVKNTSQVIFTGKTLGHALIAYPEKVCNDFVFSKAGETVIITGSNMAGKSSFLRTLGLNLCLAYTGSVVNAAHLELSLFRLFTCIRVSDSVTDGISYFYAEVKRLKALLDALKSDHPHPLFFLIDEIFRGTNNRERLIGSRAYIKALAGHEGVGLISTHDLELVKLADEIPLVTNLHFREQVIEGQMIFDYQLRDGASPTTNALKIMAMEGLPIENDKIALT